jgi:hypothetical protein
MLLLGLSLRFSYNHLLFSPTVAFPVPGVGVPGVLLAVLSPNKLLFIGLPLLSKLNRFADPPPIALWNNGLPVFGENGAFDIE